MNSQFLILHMRNSERKLDHLNDYTASLTSDNIQDILESACLFYVFFIFLCDSLTSFHCGWLDCLDKGVRSIAPDGQAAGLIYDKERIALSRPEKPSYFERD